MSTVSIVGTLFFPLAEVIILSTQSNLASIYNTFTEFTTVAIVFRLENSGYTCKSFIKLASVFDNLGNKNIMCVLKIK